MGELGSRTDLRSECWACVGREAKTAGWTVYLCNQPTIATLHFDSVSTPKGSMLSWTLGVLLAISIIDAADVLRIPLIPRERLSHQGLLSRSLAKRKVGYSPLVDHVAYQGVYVDVSYLGLVSIGTPPQDFLVGISWSCGLTGDIDTGSGVLWVADEACRGCNVSTTHLFDQSESKTLVKVGEDFQLLYGQGIISL